MSLRLRQEVQTLPRYPAASERLTAAHRAPAIHVVAGVLIDPRGRFLIAQRPAGKHLAGGWEFPGGKLEPGETRTEGLSRELAEEIGVSIDKPRPLMRLRHSYPYGEVLLDMWVVRRFRGEPRGLDGQALRWCDRAALADADLLPADRPIIRALRLPERLIRLTTPYYSVRAFDDFMADGARSARLRGALCENAAQADTAAEAGADFLVMSKELLRDELAAVCGRVPIPLFARGMTKERAWSMGASGINAIV